MVHGREEKIKEGSGHTNRKIQQQRPKHPQLEGMPLADRYLAEQEILEAGHQWTRTALFVCVLRWLCHNYKAPIT